MLFSLTVLAYFLVNLRLPLSADTLLLPVYPMKLSGFSALLDFALSLSTRSL